MSDGDENEFKNISPRHKQPKPYQGGAQVIQRKSQDTSH